MPPEPLLDPVEFVWLQAVGVHPDNGEALVTNALAASDQVGLCDDFFDRFIHSAGSARNPGGAAPCVPEAASIRFLAQSRGDAKT